MDPLRALRLMEEVRNDDAARAASSLRAAGARAWRLRVAYIVTMSRARRTVSTAGRRGARFRRSAKARGAPSLTAAHDGRT